MNWDFKVVGHSFVIALTPGALHSTPWGGPLQDSILKGQLDFQSDPWPRISKEAKDCVRTMLTQVGAHS